MSVVVIVLVGVLVLAVGGCVCVVWAARGGPPWTRAVAKATLLAGELVRASGRSGGNRNRGGSDD
ncbi:hypothetical protein ACIGO6_29295 [Streptomyces sp. NPDC053750]|uniref:hypothetical protein n=1 Tax=Streptomyces sp. NPDC053750 TaxID=3365714 RepID=UPI0037D83CFD